MTTTAPSPLQLKDTKRPLTPIITQRPAARPRSGSLLQAIQNASRRIGGAPCESGKEFRMLGVLPEPDEEEDENAEDEEEVEEDQQYTTSGMYRSAYPATEDAEELRRVSKTFSRFSFSITTSGIVRRASTPSESLCPLTPITSPNHSITISTASSLQVDTHDMRNSSTCSAKAFAADTRNDSAGMEGKLSENSSSYTESDAERGGGKDV